LHSARQSGGSSGAILPPQGPETPGTGPNTALAARSAYIVQAPHGSLTAPQHNPKAYTMALQAAQQS